MPFSAFDIIGPVMVGPSSSHTAGAARLGLMARRLLGEVPRAAAITLHGSFAATGHGHATDRALLAGLLGLAPDDASLPRSRELAAAAGLAFAFAAEDMGESVHPNTARIQLTSSEAGAADAPDSLTMTGSSLGGGVIEISSIDGYATSFRGDLDTLVCWHEDRRGFLAHITAIVACVEVNIAALRTTRTGRGTHALTVIETDGPLPSAALNLFAHIPWLARLRALPPLP
ncbi:L-serine ammonia-lyase, iron-sulfur-dependent subunit beta [Termitidicoccus mucosus]|uniref:L-serine dehydratase n=1 Tax=Termitidicoccus mucosus TaxID=1184151 RepID=A0A178IKW7_9BACT|nr:serine dehydratase [Opitutaceae bacterium TSB47]